MPLLCLVWYNRTHKTREVTGVRFETCCFSGHRVIPEDVREPLREALEQEIRF